MSDFVKDFHLGNLVLPNNIFYAPLCGCSDVPYRRMALRYQPGLVFCEMVKAEAIIRKDVHSLYLLDYEKEMHPIGAQICTSNPKNAAIAAKIIEDLGFDVLDLNCGCPVDKVTKDGSGSAMLKNIDQLQEVLSAMVIAVKIPVTVKIRTGWDANSICALEVVKIAEQCGAKAITIHGRTRAQGYSGTANWDHIRECKKQAKTIKVIGNGDVCCPQDAKNMFQHTGCDGIVLGRKTLGHPWIVDDIRHFFSDEATLEPPQRDVISELLRHFSYIMEYKPDHTAVLAVRKVACWYLKGFSGAKELRTKMQTIKNPQEALNLLKGLGV